MLTPHLLLLLLDLPLPQLLQHHHLLLHGHLRKLALLLRRKVRDQVVHRGTLVQLLLLLRGSKTRATGVSRADQGW